MTATSTDKSTTSDKPSAGTEIDTTSGETALFTSHGKTTIADTVVEKIAGIAAREVRGVHALGGSAARAFGAVRERIPGGGASLATGVTVEVGERQAAIDLDIVLDYGVDISEVTKGIRRNVINSIERMAGLEVTEVNIAVNDIFIASDEDSGDNRSESRVQ